MEIDWHDVTALTTNQDTHSAGRYVSCTILLTPFIPDTIQEKKCKESNDIFLQTEQLTIIKGQ